MVEDCAVETEEVTGDHGREDAMELRDRLRLYKGGTGGISSEEECAKPATDGLRDDFLIVPVRSSVWTFVELFHALSRDFSVGFESYLLEAGDDSGVTLLLYL